MKLSPDTQINPISKQRPTRRPAHSRKDGISYIDQKASIQWIQNLPLQNPCLLHQKNRCSIKGLGKYQQREWTHSLFAVPIVRNHLAVVELTPRSKCMYTRHPRFMSRHEWRVDKSAARTRKKSECVLRRSPIGGTNKILRVNTASGANWLRKCPVTSAGSDVTLRPRIGLINNTTAWTRRPTTGATVWSTG